MLLDVVFVKSRKKWDACIYVDSKRKFLGEHPSFDEAVYHRFAAEQCLNWGDCESNSPARKHLSGIMEGKVNIGDYVHGRP